MNSTIQSSFESPDFSHDDLANVHFANVRDVQIGGLTDGITPEVAAATGYTDPSTAIAAAGTLRAALDREASRPGQNREEPIRQTIEPEKKPTEGQPIRRRALNPAKKQPTAVELRRQQSNARDAEAAHVFRVYGQRGNADLPRHRRIFVPRSERE